MATPIDHNKLDEVILRNIRQFDKPGTLTVRPGYKMTGGWITDKPAIVVTVDKKLDGLSDADKLPAEIEDIPLDVREATGMQRLRASDPAAYALAETHAGPELQEPDWEFERSLPKGNLIANAGETDLGAMAKKPQVPYTPAATPLSPIAGAMIITANASPDAGFDVLKAFLQETKKELVIAMYDFTSGEILQELIKAITPPTVKFQMVLDHPAKNPTANQTDEQTRQAILQLGKDNAAVNWALTQTDPAVTEWIFPSAYHIKVAVRDEATVWLSSGNFNVSNQPDLAANDPSKGNLKNADRDWHLVIESQPLASLFRDYILHDFSVAQPFQTGDNKTFHQLVDESLEKLGAERSKSSFTAAVAKTITPANFFKAEVFDIADITVQPLLTPDPGEHTTMYVDNILELINSATKSLYMQTQYVHPSDSPADKDFQSLIQAFSDAHKRGVDVRLITSQYENTGQWIEKLKAFDLDQVLRIQQSVHNKGIVVDSTIVVISSQNWSSAGVLRNRDAGLIIRHAGIASYFEKIFISDWVNYATVKIVDASQPVETEEAAIDHRTDASLPEVRPVRP